MKKINLQKQEAAFMKRFSELPISPYCPLIQNKAWKCGKYDKGGEKFCKSIQGFTKCESFQKWFWFWVKKYVAGEIARGKKFPSKKKVPKKKF